MLAILRKEINSFFSSSIGYLVIGLFLLLNGLFLWFFRGEFNILDYGFAELTSFFLLAPWVLLFLIPAVTMRSFSDEKKQGTLELLLTKPISKINIVLGKYFGAFVLILLALVPTLLYVYSINQLGNPSGNLDLGTIFGSYLGLLFLVGTYTSVGVFTSSLTDNQIVSFIIAVLICIFLYIGLEGIADVTSVSALEYFGINSHYKSISRGVIDTRDIIYFLSVITFFIALTAKQLSTSGIQKNDWQRLAILLVALLLINFGSNSIYSRFDVTKDQRYTLSDSSKELIKSIDSHLIIDVFLEGEGFPAEFKRLQSETRYLLEEYKNINPNINFQFINPLEEDTSRENNLRQLTQRGLIPMQLSVQENGKTSNEVVIPWALASYQKTLNEDVVTLKIPLVKNKIGSNQQDLVLNSVQHLEYSFSDGFSKLINPKRKKIAVLQGNGQLDTPFIADYLKTIRDYYFIAPFTLDSISKNPVKTLSDLNNYDLIISAKPTESFTEEEKLALDQYTMQGGKSLWLLDAVAIEKDSLYNNNGSNVAISRDLNLTDFFFKYGLRINPVLVKDLYSAPITLAIGEGSDTQFQPIQWQYAPLAKSDNNHPIVNNIDLVNFEFANQIDTLKNSVSKTILLKSSPLTKLEGTPKLISLEEATKEPNPELFNKAQQNLAVLLEGEFTSVYNNRVLPFKLENVKTESITTKMIVIADGDVIKNAVGRSGPEELGFDKWTGKTFGNKEFLLNCTNYLLDDIGLLKLRSKTLDIAFLDYEKVADEKTKWQLLNIVFPLLILGVFGLLFNYLRRKKYTS